MHTVIISRLYSGHCQLEANLFRIDCAEIVDCENSREQITVEYFVIYCPNLGHDRRNLLDKCQLLVVPFSLANVLTELQFLSPAAEHAVATSKSV